MNETTSGNSQYTVVARRYRPQSFGDLVGQSHITQALGNAINHNRVGHAYLFTGARGVGKTSSARIFAKCLNCEKGPSDTPCNECDVCETVSIGEDIDVLEIDGASNRGIDEIRQLRANANIRPSRSKFKIYIIDEVHMLTQQAFNALLKILEEPPGHVKFIFCTTDPQKMPITVLSRCQRFDFSPVQTSEITKCLADICENEGIKADSDALELLARRAGGSMRDSQSLLEQLFSFCEADLTIDQVHQLLGTADMGRIAEFASAMADHNSAECMNLINTATLEGVDAGQLAEQTLGYFRDMMALRVGANVETLLHCGPADMEKLQLRSEGLGLETILSIVQILDQTVVRMQSSLHTRTLLEVAAIRICNLESLDVLVDLANQMVQAPGAVRPSSSVARNPASKKNDLVKHPKTDSRSNQPSAPVSTTSRSDEPEPPAEKEPEIVVPKAVQEVVSDAGPAVIPEAVPEAVPDVVAPQEELSDATTSSGTRLTKGNMDRIWQQMIESLDDMTADMASGYSKLELIEGDRLRVTLADKYTADMCNRPDRKQSLESAIASATGDPVRLEFVAAPPKQTAALKPVLSRVQMQREIEQRPIVKSAIEMFEAEVVDFQIPKPSKPSKPSR